MAASLPLVAPAALGVHETPEASRPVAAEKPPVVVVSSGPAVDPPGPLRDQLTARVAGQADDRRWRTTGGATTTSVVTLPPRTAEAIVAAEAKSALRQAGAVSVPTPAPTAIPTAVPTATPAAPKKARPMPYVATALGADVPATIRKYEQFIQRSGKEYNVDPNFIAAVIMTESSGDPDAVSPANAVGLMQLLDGPLDPEENIAGGTQTLAKWLKYFGQVDLALAAYNAGPGNVLEYDGVPPFPETHSHIARTMTRYTAYRGSVATV
ncbi:MAG TPA: transglycosylase SLT domain-containing protein [Chloroflexota bacterium]|nr:transglycosylase SLT domain-containing protein [Chloroflexota bacterium]